MSRRANEIGIRLALGAARRDMLAMMLRQAGVLVAAGACLGAVLGLTLASRAHCSSVSSRLIPSR